MEAPTLNPVVTEPATKTKRPMSEAQLESLAKAREKALEVRKARAAQKKHEAENPPDLKPVFHGEEPPEPPPPTTPTAPEMPQSPTPPPPVRQPATSSDDSDSEEDRIEAEVQRRLRKAKDKVKEKRSKKRARFVVEESESEEEEGEVILVRKKPKVAQRPVFQHQPNPFHSVYPRPGTSFRRY